MQLVHDVQNVMRNWYRYMTGNAHTTKLYKFETISYFVFYFKM